MCVVCSQLKSCLRKDAVSDSCVQVLHGYRHIYIINVHIGTGEEVGVECV